MKFAALLLSALLGFFPATPRRACLERRQAELAATVDAAVAHPKSKVPAALLVAVGFLETYLGCRPGIGWGCPAPGPDRDRPGTPRDAAMALVRSYRVCGARFGWTGAVARYRCGRCVCGRSLVGYRPEVAMKLAARLEDAAQGTFAPEPSIAVPDAAAAFEDEVAALF